MNNFSKFLFLIVLLSGCAGNQVLVTYYSNPTGALFFKGQKVVGYTPVTIEYDVQPGTEKERHLNLQGAKVVWASGASITIDSLDLVQGQGANFYFTFIRPNVPGREIDFNFASELQQNLMLVQQTESQKIRNYLQMYNNYRRSYATSFESFNCTSAQAGSYIYADCH